MGNGQRYGVCTAQMTTEGALLSRLHVFHQQRPEHERLS